MATRAPDPAFEAVMRLGRSALAWEVLRRNPAYRAAFHALPALPEAGMAAGPDFTADWGLHFP